MTDRRGPYDFVYVHTDIPEGMTIREWRGQRAVERRPSASKGVRPAASVSALLTATRRAAAKMCRAVRLVVARDGYPRPGIRSYRRTTG